MIKVGVMRPRSPLMIIQSVGADDFGNSGVLDQCSLSPGRSRRAEDEDQVFGTGKQAECSKNFGETRSSKLRALQEGNVNRVRLEFKR
jgi:hypothetical protein